jgi:hypothetical protein
MKKHADYMFARIALESPEISGLLEDLGYGPWRQANAKHEKRKSRKSKRARGRSRGGRQ